MGKCNVLYVLDSYTVGRAGSLNISQEFSIGRWSEVNREIEMEILAFLLDRTVYGM